MFTNCFAEGFPGFGCEIANASQNTFIGCSFEAVGIGVNIDNDSFRNRFVSTWFEQNSIADARILGAPPGQFSVGNNFSNCYFGSVAPRQPNISIARGQATMFEGGFLRSVDLQSVSRDTLFLGTVFADHAGLGITGVGS